MNPKQHPVQILMDPDLFKVAQDEASRRGIAVGPLFRTLLLEASNRLIFDAWMEAKPPDASRLREYDAGAFTPHFKLAVRQIDGADGLWCWVHQNLGGNKGFTGPLSLEALFSTGFDEEEEDRTMYLRGDGFWSVTRRLAGLPGTPVNIYLKRLAAHPKAKKK